MDKKGGREKVRKRNPKDLRKDLLWEGIGLLDTDEDDLSKRDDWRVVEWKSE